MPGDVRHEFLRCDSKGREAFRRERSARENRQVDQELRYLACIQADLRKDRRREQAVARLRECYMMWKEEAKRDIKPSLSQLHNTYPDPAVRDKYGSLLERLDEHWPEPSPPHTTGTTQGEDGDEDYFNMNTYAMYFKKNEASPGSGGSEDSETSPEPQTWIGHDSDDTSFSGRFPNQKIPAETLLDQRQDSPLKRSSGSNCIRYFHIPTNNMKWVEKAISRYYEEKDVVFSENGWSNMTPAQKVLSREFWSGQMHGSSEGAPVHGRHMRSRCSLIPRVSMSQQSRREPKAEDESETYDTPKTDDTTSTGSEPMTGDKPKADGEPSLMDGKALALFLPYLHWETNNGRVQMSRFIDSAQRSRVPKQAPSKTKPVDPSPDMPRNRSFSNVVADILQQVGAEKKRARYFPPSRSWLAQYLLLLAKLGADVPSDDHARLFRANIHREPPMHPRRTLDQYYFSTLKDTILRDKDQVVYRGTKTRSFEGSSWHEPQIVMVDQLWLWILDDNTVITSFPRRWGRNRLDSSDVHKSLRVRFEKDYTIKSAYHLALIIIDHCSKVFFDRTKPPDRRPEVVDIFGSAIGHVTTLAARASERSWQQMFIPPTMLSSIPLDHNFLTIRPEGMILRESQDIAEELQIMMRVFHEQSVVVKEFKRHIIPAIDPLIQLEVIKHKHGQRWDQLVDFSQDADMLMELIDKRRTEIQDLEDSVQRVCQQVLELLTVKQQQVSIIESKRSALVSVHQGQTIMALTLVTIFFLPLGFFAAFFGMNNKLSTDNPWMTLSEQVIYMFSISIPIITVILGGVFRGALRTWWKRFTA